MGGEGNQGQANKAKLKMAKWIPVPEDEVSGVIQEHAQTVAGIRVVRVPPLRDVIRPERLDAQAETQDMTRRRSSRTRERRRQLQTTMKTLHTCSMSNNRTYRSSRTTAVKAR